MDPTDIGLFRLAEQRLGWVDRRQQLLAQNVANANTPGYQPRDRAPFSTTMAGPLSQTAPNHIAFAGHTAAAALQRPAERAITGNSVSIEEQLGKVADTSGIQELTLNLHRSYQTMLRTALGRAG